MTNSVEKTVNALMAMEEKVSSYLAAQQAQQVANTPKIDMRLEAPVWRMHLNRASKAVNRGYMLNDAIVLANIMTRRKESLLDILWEEGYRESDYLRIEDGVKIARTDSSEITKLKLPRKDEAIMPYFIAYKNGVFLLGDTVNRHYILTEDVQMVNAMKERGYVYQENIDVPMSDIREYFINPFKNYKWRRHHKKAMAAIKKHHSAVLAMSMCSPSTPSEAQAEAYLFKAEREKNRARNKGKFHISAMPQDMKDDLKRSAKILAGIVASLVVTTSIASQIVSCEQKDEPTQPRVEQKISKQTGKKPNQRGGYQR